MENQHPDEIKQGKGAEHASLEIVESFSSSSDRETKRVYRIDPPIIQIKTHNIDQSGNGIFYAFIKNK